MDVLHLVVDSQTSHRVWRTLEHALTSSFNSRIVQLYDSFQDLDQGDDLITVFIQEVYQYMHAHADAYWVVIKCILHYLKGTIFFGLHITRSSSFFLYGFTNADWADSVNNHKSIGGHLVFLGHTPISWKSGKQCTMTCSFTEDEYKTLADDTFEIIWIQYLLSYLHVTLSFVPMI